MPRETGRGLGADSEHALEAAHHDFLVIWQRFYVRDVSSPKYAERPLKAVVTYNASHTPFDQVLSRLEAEITHNDTNKEQHTHTADQFKINHTILLPGADILVQYNTPPNMNHNTRIDKSKVLVSTKIGQTVLVSKQRYVSHVKTLPCDNKIVMSGI